MATVIFYNKNHPLAKIELKGTAVTEIKEVYKENALFLPMSLKGRLHEKTLSVWISKRVLPKSREGIKEVRKYFPGFDQYRHMFSLSDQYWFSYSDSDSWEEGNFFTNNYPTTVGDMFFTPWSVSYDGEPIESPDLTSNGVLKKQWIKKNGKESYLLKAGSKVYHQEPISEVLASMFLEKLKLVETVHYDLTVHGLRLCSECKNFVDENTEFIPASQIYRKEARNPMEESVYDHLIRMCNTYGASLAKPYIDNMIAADRMLGNDDRHLGNFGFLRDVNTGQIIRFAPLFDNGSAFWDSASRPNRFQIAKETADEITKEVFSDLEGAIEIEDMLTVVEEYPDMSDEKRQDVRSKVIEAGNRVNQILEQEKTMEKTMRIARDEYGAR